MDTLRARPVRRQRSGAGVAQPEQKPAQNRDWKRQLRLENTKEKQQHPEQPRCSGRDPAKPFRRDLLVPFPGLERENPAGITPGAGGNSWHSLILSQLGTLGPVPKFHKRAALKDKATVSVELWLSPCPRCHPRPGTSALLCVRAQPGPVLLTACTLPVLWKLPQSPQSPAVKAQLQSTSGQCSSYAFPPP